MNPITNNKITNNYMHYLFSIGLFIHIIGITCIAGGSIGGLILENHIWKQIKKSPEGVKVLGPLMPKYPVIIQAGTLLMLISGMMMLAALGWALAGQWWFIIKMVFVVGLVLNGILIARPNGKELRKLVLLLMEGQSVQTELQAVKKTMTLFHISEMTMLLIVYLLAIFRF